MDLQKIMLGQLLELLLFEMSLQPFQKSAWSVATLLSSSPRSQAEFRRNEAWDATILVAAGVRRELAVRLDLLHTLLLASFLASIMVDHFPLLSWVGYIKLDQTADFGISTSAFICSY